jgi:hypothetical protein
MLRNIVIHADYSTPPREVYLLVNTLIRNKTDYVKAFYHNEGQVANFFASMNTAFLDYIAKNNITITCPLSEPVMTAVTSNNSMIIRTGRLAIIEAIQNG